MTSAPREHATHGNERERLAALRLRPAGRLWEAIQRDSCSDRDPHGLIFAQPNRPEITLVYAIWAPTDGDPLTRNP